MAAELTHPETAQRRGEPEASAASLLSLAATPTFAAMALVTALVNSGAPVLLCLGGRHASPLTGMVMMYGLMSLFHAPPWLRLLTSRRAA